MSNTLVLQLSSPPDLLRRFLPLNNELCIRASDCHFHLITNEPQLATALGATAVEYGGGDSGEINCTILCDSELPPELGEGISTETSNTVFISFGRGCFITVDRENREIIGFVAAQLLDGSWSAVIFPALMAVMAAMQ